MKIKAGDKVKVSKDAPREIVKNEVIPTAREFTVTAVGGFYAEIKLNGALLPTYFSIPTKYLVKVDAEAKEPRFKKDDKVCINESSLKHGLRGEILTIIGVDVSDKTYLVQSICMRSPIWLREDEISLYTAPTIKVGADEYKYTDKQVWNSRTKQNGVIKRITNGWAEVFTEYGEHKVWSLMDLVDEYDDPFEKWKPTQPTEQPKASVDVLGEFTPIPRFDNPIIGFEQAYWREYEADLAKEIAVMLVRTHRNDLNKVAKMSVDIAKTVVEGLKGK